MVITQLCSGSKAYDFFRVYVEQGNPLLKSLTINANTAHFWIIPSCCPYRLRAFLRTGKGQQKVAEKENNIPQSVSTPTGAHE